LGAHDVDNNYTMTFAGTDFHIPQKGIAKKGNTFTSHKYAGKSALHYELDVNNLVGNLVWIQGPYPASKYIDFKFSTKSSLTSLSQASGLWPKRDTVATPTKSNALEILWIWQRSGQCRGG
jgi:hypothetical protein